MNTTTKLGTIELIHDENCVCEGTGKVLKADGFEMVDTYPCTEGKIVHKGAHYNRDGYNRHTGHFDKKN